MNIFVAGTFNSGKTTFINKIKKTLEVKGNKDSYLWLLGNKNSRYKEIIFYEEQATEDAKKGIAINNEIANETSIRYIEKIKERVKNRNEKTVQVHDESILNVYAYAKWNKNESIEKEISKVNIEEAIGVTIYLPPICKIEDNGIRMTDRETQKIIDTLIIESISKKVKPFGCYFYNRYGEEIKSETEPLDFNKPMVMSYNKDWAERISFILLKKYKKYYKDRKGRQVGPLGITNIFDFNFKDVTNSNLIIHGDNLSVLRELGEHYNRKVKLVYIDPPYNTQKNSKNYTYKNTFGYSAWQNFMRDRVRVASELITEGGVVAIAIDHHELFYIGQLADEIFGRKNRIAIITVVHLKAGRQHKHILASNEFMLLYTNDISKVKLNRFEMTAEKEKEFKYKDQYGKYKLEFFIRGGSNCRKEDRPSMHYPIYYDKETKEISIDKKKGYETLYPNTNGEQRTWRWGKETAKKEIHNLILKKNKSRRDSLYKSKIRQL